MDIMEKVEQMEGDKTIRVLRVISKLLGWK